MPLSCRRPASGIEHKQRFIRLNCPCVQDAASHPPGQIILVDSQLSVSLKSEEAQGAPLLQGVLQAHYEYSVPILQEVTFIVTSFPFGGGYFCHFQNADFFGCSFPPL